jgi:hypothetical protein
LACRTVVPLALASLILAACGGSDDEWRAVGGPGYTVNVPARWEVTRPPRTIAAETGDGPESVSVAVFRLGRPFRPALWDDAVQELNDVAARLAERLAPSALVDMSRDGTIAGRRARVYEIGYRRGATQLVDRVAFVLVGRREFQLTCRIAAERDDGERACDELFDSFRLR